MRRRSQRSHHPRGSSLISRDLLKSSWRRFARVPAGGVTVTFEPGVSLAEPGSDIREDPDTALVEAEAGVLRGAEPVGPAVRGAEKRPFAQEARKSLFPLSTSLCPSDQVRQGHGNQPNCDECQVEPSRRTELTEYVLCCLEQDRGDRQHSGCGPRAQPDAHTLQTHFCSLDGGAWHAPAAVATGCSWMSSAVRERRFSADVWVGPSYADCGEFRLVRQQLCC